MKYIISGTNRPNSRSVEVARIVQQIYKDLGEEIELIDLAQLDFSALNGSQYSAKSLPTTIGTAIEKVNHAEGLIVVCPEYNGSYPGILKYFIDHWKYPDSYEHRPICMIGLGATFGGLRPVEHLQQVFNYRNAYVLPNRVFLTNISQTLKDGKLIEILHMELLRVQAKQFIQFVRALQNEKMDANSWLSSKQKQ